jgi:hypothetical protein
MEFIQCSYLPNGYLINKEGNVKSPKGKILKQNISNSGYYFINIKNKGYFIHRALCFSFIENINNDLIVNHKDGNKKNNSLDNLEWCDRSYNIKHMYKLELKKYKPLHYKNKFGTEHNRSKKVICLKDNIQFGSMSEAERYYNLGQGSVSWAVKHKKPIFGMHFEIGS